MSLPFNIPYVVCGFLMLIILMQTEEWDQSDDCVSQSYIIQDVSLAHYTNTTRFFLFSSPSGCVCWDIMSNVWKRYKCPLIGHSHYPTMTAREGRTSLNSPFFLCASLSSRPKHRQTAHEFSRWVKSWKHRQPRPCIYHSRHLLIPPFEEETLCVRLRERKKEQKRKKETER